jgi:hypothetical protein
MMHPGEVYQTREGKQLKIIEIDAISVSYYRCGSGEHCFRKCPISWFEYQQYRQVRDSLGFPIH